MTGVFKIAVLLTGLLLSPAVFATEDAPLCETALNCILDHDKPTVENTDTSNSAVIPLKNLKPTNKVFQNTAKSIYTFNSLFEQCIPITQTAVLEKIKRSATPEKNSLHSMNFKFLLFSQTELCAINKFSKLLQTHRKELCLQQNNVDCTFNFFQGKLRTGTGIATALVSVAASGQMDNSVLPTEQRTPVHLIDRGLQLIEQARSEAFYLQTLRSGSSVETSELTLLKQHESAQFNMSIKRFLEISEAKLKEERAPASDNHKQSLLLRIQKLRSRSWKHQ